MVKFYLGGQAPPSPPPPPTSTPVIIGVGGGGGGAEGHCAPQNFWKPKIRAKAVGNSGKSNGNLGQKQWEIRGNAMGNSGKSNNFCPKYMSPLSEFSHCFCPNFPLLNFAQISHCFFPEIRAKAIGNSLLLPEFPIAFAQSSHCFCPNFPLLFPEIRAKAYINIWAKAMRKLGKRWDIFQAKLCMEVLGNFANCHIIFKIYFLDQIKILKDLIGCPNFLCPKFPIYLKILYFRFGRERYEKNRACYCEQI